MSRTSGGRWKLTVFQRAGPQTTTGWRGLRQTNYPNCIRRRFKSKGVRGEMGTSEKVGFNLSMETTSVLSPSDGGRTYLCAPGPDKGCGKEEPEEELKHLLS